MSALYATNPRCGYSRAGAIPRHAYSRPWMTCSTWRTDRPRGYDHRRTRPGVHQRERAAAARKRDASTPNPPIYPMAQVHRHACLQVHLSSTPGIAPTGTRPDEQQWNQSTSCGCLSTVAPTKSEQYRSKTPNLGLGASAATGRVGRPYITILYTDVSERVHRCVLYRPTNGLPGLSEAKPTAPHTPTPPRHNWRTMHP